MELHQAAEAQLPPSRPRQDAESAASTSADDWDATSDAAADQQLSDADARIRQLQALADQSRSILSAIESEYDSTLRDLEILRQISEDTKDPTKVLPGSAASLEKTITTIKKEHEHAFR
jgi:chromosome segregation ATPase